MPQHYLRKASSKSQQILVGNAVLTYLTSQNDEILDFFACAIGETIKEALVGVSLSHAIEVSSIPLLRTS